MKIFILQLIQEYGVYIYNINIYKHTQLMEKTMNINALNEASTN